MQTPLNERGSLQYVDPVVTRQKFEAELAAFNSAKEIQRKRGILLLEAEYPNLYFGFFAARLNPPPAVFGVKMNYHNYDMEPVSIRFIDPFTFVPLTAEQMKVHFPRRLGKVENGEVTATKLLVWQDDGIPFLCLPGVREYHQHVAHTGDSWFLHRGRGGEGSLGFLLDKLYLYGIESINGYQYQIVVQSPAVRLFHDPRKIPD